MNEISDKIGIGLPNLAFFSSAPVIGWF